MYNVLTIQFIIVLRHIYIPLTVKYIASQYYTIISSIYDLSNTYKEVSLIVFFFFLNATHHKRLVRRADKPEDGVLHHLGPLNKSFWFNYKLLCFPQEPKFGTQIGTDSSS